jgi:hypothetical protein
MDWLRKMRYLSPPALLVIIIFSGLIFPILANNGVASTLILDQKQETSSGSIAGIIGNEPTGQSFIPTLSPLAAVEVFITTDQPAGDDTITCRIRDSTIDGAILGTASQSVTFGFGGWLQFTFDPPITVNPGSTYVIELDANVDTFGWNIQNVGNPYPDGAFIVLGILQVNVDSMFRTYSIPPPVGGVIAPVDKLAVLTPYLALAGLIIAVSVIVIRKRKD